MLIMVGLTMLVLSRLSFTERHEWYFRPHPIKLELCTQLRMHIYALNRRDVTGIYAGSFLSTGRMYTIRTLA